MSKQRSNNVKLDLLRNLRPKENNPVIIIFFSFFSKREDIGVIVLTRKSGRWICHVKSTDFSALSGV